MKSFTASDFKDILVFLENKEYERANFQLIEIHEFMKNILNQESAHIMYYIAYCQDCLRNPYKAIEWVNRSLEIDPYNYFYASFRATVLCEVEESIDQLIPYGVEKLAEVEKIYQYLMKEGHIRSNLQFNLIRYHIKINNLESAKLMLENFLERNPNDSEATFMYATLMSYGVKKTQAKQKAIKAA